MSISLPERPITGVTKEVRRWLDLIGVSDWGELHGIEARSKQGKRIDSLLIKATHEYGFTVVNGRFVDTLPGKLLSQRAARLLAEAS